MVGNPKRKITKEKEGEIMNKKGIISTVAGLIIGEAWLALCDHIDGKTIENSVDALYWAGAEQVGYTQTRLPFTYQIWWTGCPEISGTAGLKKLVKIYKKIKKSNKGKEMPDYMGMSFYEDVEAFEKILKKNPTAPFKIKNNSKEVSE